MLSATPPGHVLSTPTWTRTRAWTFAESNAIHYTTGISCQYPALESNQD